MPKRRLAQAGEDVGKVRDQVTLMRRKSTQGGGDRGQEQVASMIEQEVRTVTPPPSFSTTAAQFNIHNVWIIGDSLVRGAQKAALSRPGANLGLGDSVNVLWESISGMKINDLNDTVNYLLTFNPPPEVLIIHCGGNDLGSDLTTLDLTWTVKNMLTDWLGMMPNTKFIWSQILPRMSWRYIPDYVIANKMRSRINS